MESKPKTWIISKQNNPDDYDMECTIVGPKCLPIEVVELRAFKDLQAECETLKKQLDDMHDATIITIKAMQKERSAVQADTLELVRGFSQIVNTELDVIHGCASIGHEGVLEIKAALEAFQAKNEWAKVGK